MARRGLGRAPFPRRRDREGVPLPGLRSGDRARHPARGRVARRPGRRPRGRAPPLAPGVLGKPPEPHPESPPPAPSVTPGPSPRTGIRAGTVLPARRTPVTLPTPDGLELVGELALPAAADPVATLICLHPLPTQGGMMDSHLFKKAAARLPAQAQLAVLRFNTRGTTSERGTSQGTFGRGETEQHDVAAAVAFAASAGLPARWLAGWSFGTELALRWGLD